MSGVVQKISPHDGERNMMVQFCLLLNAFGKLGFGVSPAENKCGLGNLMDGKHLKCLDQGRVIEITITGIE